MSRDGEFQFGGATVVPSDVRLLIFDCFETLVEMEARVYRARQGIPEILRHFTQAGVQLAVLSDGEQVAVEAALAQAGLEDGFAAIIGAPESLGQLADGRMLKRLDSVIARFCVPVEQAVFIGDSPLDAAAAQHHAVPFIRVPRSEDRDFSFAKLINGPSRYHSSEFSNVFLERYLKRKTP